MKKGITLVLALVFSVASVTVGAQEVKKKQLKTKAKVVVTVKAKDGKLKKMRGKTDVAVAYVAAGQACTTEGEQKKETSNVNGTCQVLGKARPCKCDVTVTFECRDGEFRGVDQKIGLCAVNEKVPVPGFNDIPETLFE